MRLRNLKAENFGPFEQVEVSLDADDAYLFIGENGSGKSTLMEAVFWCCTGEGVRETTAADVVRDGQSATKVTATFEFADGMLVVERKWTKSAKTLRFVTPDGECSTFHTAAEGTKALFEYLGFDKATLSLIVFFGKRFNAFSRMKAAARADLVDRLIGASRWLDASEKAGKAANRYDSEVSSISAALSNWQGTKQNWAEMVAELEEQLAAEKQRKKANTVAARQKAEAVAETLGTAKEALAKARARLSSLEAEEAEFDTWLRKAERKQDNIKARVATLQESLEKQLAESCPTCGEALSTAAVKRLKAQKREQEQELAELKDALAQAQDKIQQAGLDLMEVRQDIAQCRKVVDEHQQTVTTHKTEAAAAEQVLAAAQATQAEASNLQSSLDRAKDALDEALERIAEKEKALAECSDLAEKARYWKTGFKHVHSYLMNKALKIMQEWANYYATALGFNGGKLCISPWKENQSGGLKTEVTLTTEVDGYVHSIGALSDGQTQRVDLACFLAFGDLVRVLQGVDIQFRIFDEPLAHLDDSGKYAVFQLLKDLPTVGQRLVIDHDAHFRDQFPQKFQVTRINGISTLSQE